MLIKRFLNKIFNSNTYLLYQLEEKSAWVIDPGSSTDQLIKWFENHKKQLAGILLTHTHFDHIYGLNDLQERYPNAKVYASFYASDGMNSDKHNGSLYKEIPFIIKRSEYIIVKGNDKILLWENIFVRVIETPGHNRDCISFHIDKNLFTGDALIPGIKVHTKLKYSNKTLADNSIKKIFDVFPEDTMIWPGHELNCLLHSLSGDYQFKYG